MELSTLIQNIQQVDFRLKSEANRSINRLLTIRNWLTGYFIVEFEQKGNDRADYGSKLLEVLSEKINQKGFSTRNLKLFRQFYLSFPEIAYPVSLILKEEEDSVFPFDFKNQLIGQTPSAQLIDDKYRYLLATDIIEKLSFSHICLLFPLKEYLQKEFYAVESINGTWSVKELKRQINSLLFERSSLSENPEVLIQKIKKEDITNNQLQVVKDVYAFEFLNLPTSHVIEESDLETGLLDHLREFILEIGNGFCFEARQKRILIGDDYFFIDLVFYHRILKCHILIELKVDEFNHSHIGQLNTYVNYYKKEIQAKDDNPPIGILLVTNKNDALVEYAVSEMDKNLFVSRYKLNLPSKEKLEEFIINEIRKA